MPKEEMTKEENATEMGKSAGKLFTFTIDASTAQVVRLEAEDASGARHELSDEEKASLAQAGTVGLYGTFDITSGGAWTYTASSAHDEFVAGTTYTDTFSVATLRAHDRGAVRRGGGPRRAAGRGDRLPRRRHPARDHPGLTRTSAVRTRTHSRAG